VFGRVGRRLEEERDDTTHDNRADAMIALFVDLATLTPAEQRDLANALLRAAWSAALEETRVLLLDLSLETDRFANPQPE